MKKNYDYEFPFNRRAKIDHTGEKIACPGTIFNLLR